MNFCELGIHSKGRNVSFAALWKPMNVFNIIREAS